MPEYESRYAPFALRPGDYAIELRQPGVGRAFSIVRRVLLQCAERNVRCYVAGAR